MRIFICLLLPFIIKAQTWVQLTEYPGTKRDDGVAIAVNNKAYFGTGLQEWNATIDFRCLDLSTLTWSQIPNMPHTTERQYACAFKGEDCFYIFGGYNNGALNSLFKYDIVNSSWTEMTPKPGNGLTAAVAFDFGDKVIISNGKHSDNTLNYEVWEYSKSTDQWSQKNNISVPPVWRGSSASKDNNTGYLIFGIDSGGTFSNSLFRYDLSLDAWSHVNNFTVTPARAYSSMGIINDRIFFFGGMDSAQTFYGDSWYYDITGDQFFKGPSIPGAGRRGGMACMHGNNFYYSCGLSMEGRLTETWRTDVPSSLTEISGTEFLIFPNPFTDHIRVTGDLVKGSRYEVVSITGEIVNTGFIEAHNIIELNDIIPGIYSLQIKDPGGKRFTKRLVCN